MDVSLISSWIEPGTKVLDLGCGDGALLDSLVKSHQVLGYGIEIDAERIARCVARGINVIEKDLDKGLGDFPAGSFDTVIMSQTLHEVRSPALLIREIVEVGHQAIISFVNFGYLPGRFLLMAKGRSLVSEPTSDAWDETANIHPFTAADFEAMCKVLDITISGRIFLNALDKPLRFSKLRPNLLAKTAIYRIKAAR